MFKLNLGKLYRSETYCCNAEIEFKVIYTFKELRYRIEYLKSNIQSCRICNVVKGERTDVWIGSHFESRALEVHNRIILN